jgi:hypothetical protein
VDLSALQPLGNGYEWANDDPPSAYARVTGRDRNFVVFATTAKHRGNYYLAMLQAVMGAANGRGRGLMTTTGEITHDGKDRFVIARAGTLLTLPTARVYDPQSPWNAVYRWSHYMHADHVLARPGRSGSTETTAHRTCRAPGGQGNRGRSCALTT